MTLGTQNTSASAVQFIASDIPSANIRAFWDGSTLWPPTAPNALMRPNNAPIDPNAAAAATTATSSFVASEAPFLRFQVLNTNHTVVPIPIVHLPDGTWSLVCEIPPPTSDRRRAISIWLDEKRVPSPEFGAWHAHALTTTFDVSGSTAHNLGNQA